MSQTPSTSPIQRILVLDGLPVRGIGSAATCSPRMGKVSGSGSPRQRGCLAQCNVVLLCNLVPSLGKLMSDSLGSYCRGGEGSALP